MARKTAAAKTPRTKTPRTKAPRTKTPRTKTSHAIPVALAGARIDARLAGAMAEIRIGQSFHNTEDAPIEAVYSFPLPAGAVLLDVGVEIGGRRLQGDVAGEELTGHTVTEQLVDRDQHLVLVAGQEARVHVGGGLPGYHVHLRSGVQHGRVDRVAQGGPDDAGKRTQHPYEVLRVVRVEVDTEGIRELGHEGAGRVGDPHREPVLP